MQIPVANLTRYGAIVGSVLYDTVENRFTDSNTVCKRSLPVQDYLDCTVNNNSCITVVGEIPARNMYVCCFGDNFCYELREPYLRKFTISNMKLDHENRLQCMDGKLDDLSYLFPDDRIEFVSLFWGSNQSSKGIARKFSARYNGKLCIVKFTKGNNEDLDNELRYKQICDLLGVNCCQVYVSEYYGKKCAVSVYAYGKEDIYISFKNLNRTVEQIVSSFSPEDKRMFDKYLLLDYILLQQDRHYSNLAVVNNGLYPLFDNGECLGLGSISSFSRNFRTYIERLDRNYLKSLFDPDERMYEYLNESQKPLVRNEVAKIW